MSLGNISHEDFESSNQSKLDEGLLVKFFIKAKPDQEATAREGRPIFKDVTYIDIKIPGDRTAGACRPARAADINRFPRHYRAFEERVNNEDIVEGTPLSEWPKMTRTLVEELAFFNVKTVEQLCEMSDTNAAQFMGGMTRKQEAKIWLDNVNEQKSKDELAASLKERDDEIDTLKAQVAELIEANKKPKTKAKAKKKVEKPPEISED